MAEEYKQYLYVDKSNGRDKWTLGIASSDLSEVLRTKKIDEKMFKSEVRIYEFDRRTGKIKELSVEEE